MDNMILVVLVREVIYLFLLSKFWLFILPDFVDFCGQFQFFW